MSKPFRSVGSTTLAITTSTANVAIPYKVVNDRSGNFADNFDGNNRFGRTLRLVATAAMFVRIGSSSVAATTSDIELPANTEVFLAVDPDRETHVAGIVGSSTATLYISVGHGGS